MCAIGWAGHGYSPEFSANMDAVVIGRLRADPQTTVEFTNTADTICTPCPHRRGTGCSSADKITELDRQHAAALGIRAGDRMSWHEAQSHAISCLKPDDLDQICSRCQWLEYGLCKQALQRLQE
ncbi:MAG: DUF1284 domain-containing protein [Paracoccus sp. (in: a-proteobacteria)]